MKIADIGHIMETEARKRGYRVIKNLCGHGIGRRLHEQSDELLNYKKPTDQRRFKKNAVAAIETFISTISSYAVELEDGWTMVGNRGGFMAQHEHTIVVTDVFSRSSLRRRMAFGIDKGSTFRSFFGM